LTKKAVIKAHAQFGGHLTPLSGSGGGDQLEFHQDLWYDKTRICMLLSSVDYLIMVSAVSIERLR